MLAADTVHEQQGAVIFLPTTHPPLGDSLPITTPCSALVLFNLLQVVGAVNALAHGHAHLTPHRSTPSVFHLLATASHPSILYPLCLATRPRWSKRSTHWQRACRTTPPRQMQGRSSSTAGSCGKGTQSRKRCSRADDEMPGPTSGMVPGFGTAAGAINALFHLKLSPPLV